MLTLPFDQTIDETMRVVHLGLIYDVVWVDGTELQNIHIRAILKSLA